jgi:hypothetical protein
MARDPVTVHTGPELKRITLELRRMNQREILKRFRKDLRKAAAPLVPAVRQSIRQIPSKRGYTAQGLRGQLSRATALEVKTSGRQAGVAIRVDGRKMPTHMKALPAYMEGTKRPWRHPVYGNRNAWVNQQPPHPYFYKVMRTAGPAARAVVDRTIRGIARDIT